jgi:Na+/melibiose symporter-like transporter
VLGLWGFTIAFGLAFGAAPTLLRSMMADLTDEDELKSGQKRAGLYFALLTTTNKLGAALGVGLSFTILDWAFGFVPGTQNDHAALDGLLLTYALGTAGGLLLAALPLLTYPMTREKHGEIVAALRAREQATGAPGAGD